MARLQLVDLLHLFLVHTAAPDGDCGQSRANLEEII
jgi:hypothetical protein